MRWHGGCKAASLEACEGCSKLHHTLHGSNAVWREFVGGRPTDAIGAEVLSWLGRIGTEFVGENVHSLDVCERLHLPWRENEPTLPPSDATALVNLSARTTPGLVNSRASLPQVRPPISHRSALCLDVFPILDSLT